MSFYYDLRAQGFDFPDTEEDDAGKKKTEVSNHPDAASSQQEADDLAKGIANFCCSTALCTVLLLVKKRVLTCFLIQKLFNWLSFRNTLMIPEIQPFCFLVKRSGLVFGRNDILENIYFLNCKKLQFSKFLQPLLCSDVVTSDQSVVQLLLRLLQE